MLDNQRRVATFRTGTISRRCDPRCKFHLADHLGNSNLIVDDTGQLVNREEFTPYGETSFGSFARKRYRFGGKEKDEESGLHYFGARYCANWLCRFVTIDPLAERDANASPYQYAFNNPLNYVDPSGLAPQPAQHANEVHTSQEQPSDVLQSPSLLDQETSNGQRQAFDDFIGTLKNGDSGAHANPFEQHRQQQAYEDFITSLGKDSRVHDPPVEPPSSLVDLPPDPKDVRAARTVFVGFGLVTVGILGGMQIAMSSMVFGVVGRAAYVWGTIGAPARMSAGLGSLALAITLQASRPQARQVAQTGVAAVHRLGFWERVGTEGPRHFALDLPRWFSFLTDSGRRYFVNANATKHVFEAIVGTGGRTPGMGPSHGQKLMAEARFKELGSAVNTAAQRGFEFSRMIIVNGWELHVLQSQAQSGL